MRRIANGIEAIFWLLSASLLLRLIPFNRLFREIPPDTSPPRLDPSQQDAIVRIRGTVSGAARRLPWQPTCLPQSLAATLMCRVRGMQVPIALSVANRRGFAAHARLDSGSDAELAALAPEGRTHLGRITLTF